MYTKLLWREVIGCSVVIVFACAFICFVGIMIMVDVQLLVWLFGL